MYNPPGVVFPESAAIYRNIQEYQHVLESYSRILLPLIEWRETEKHNVDVLNDTADFYRFFDATAHAEFTFDCVRQTIDIDLPNEVRFLEAFDRFSDEVQRIVDMPARTIELLRALLAQGSGKLSRRARENEFSQLTPAELDAIEALYDRNFGWLSSPAVLGAPETSAG